MSTTKTLTSVAYNFAINKLSELKACRLNAITSNTYNSLTPKAYKKLSLSLLRLNIALAKGNKTNGLLKIPRFADMLIPSHFLRAKGPQLLRTAAKAYGILNARFNEHFSILPYDSEAKTFLHVSFGRNEVMRGNILLTTEESLYEKPSLLKVIPSSIDSSYTLLFIDADFANGKERKTFALWKVSEIKADAEGQILNMASGKEDLCYLPPLPQRGTDYHRYLFVLLKEPSLKNSPAFSDQDKATFTRPTSVSQTSASKSNDIEKRDLSSFTERFIDIKQLINLKGYSVESYAFFRACWTKETSNMLKVLGLKEDIYGVKSTQ